MEKHLVPGDPVLIENIVKYLKAKGIFDEFRHECLADVDTKSSCQNLSQRVDGYTTKFLSGEKWHPDLNKNELRNKLRRHIDESGMLAGGADHVVEQVINPKINQLFLPRIIEVVHQYLNEENEKLNKMKESSDDNVNSERQSAENTDGTNKTKSTKVDPIADILSFSYSKPKSNPAQNAQTKVMDLTKAERKKDENVPQTKLSEALPKAEKKKDESINPIKVSEVVSKVKKDDAISDVIQSNEKDKEENVSIKIDSVDFVAESSPAAVLQTKPQIDSKDSIKLKKEVKVEELEASFDPLKKPQKEDIKPEKKKCELEKKKEDSEKKNDSERKKDDSEKKKDDFKTSSDLSSLSEEGGQVKVVQSAPKSSSVIKNKSETEKSKKVKPHSSSKTSNDSQKSKTKDSDKGSSKSSDKLKISSKVPKLSTKDHPSPHKNSGTSKSSKSDRTEDNNKSKSKDGHSKPSTSKPSTSKLSSIKKESTSVKSKPSIDKTKISKSSDLKPKIKTHTELFEKVSKSGLQYSSYDSSQGSDQDKGSTSNSHQKEKHKHFSKHHKKENNNKSSEKVEKTPDKKRFQSDSDSGTPIKHKHMKHISEKEKKKSLSIQESAKISSRSNSFGSTSSVSDSPSSSSKETSASTSEETSDNSLKSSEAKKSGIKDKERCKQNEDFPPPPPPPPTSGISAPGLSSAEVSSMDETQSSQESESDSKLSEDESSSESDVENLYSSNTLKNSNLESRLKTPGILNDVYDVFLYSSSSSEFEGYSSAPEKGQIKIQQIDDVYVSSVHTSDLSSFDNFLSESEYSNSDIDEDRPKRRLTIKEAEKLLEEKARKRRLERTKNVLSLKGLLDDKKLNNSPQVSTSVLAAEDESSPIPEPKRESRRERKLNPKYASSEYASIFNSKKTSFITKQVNSYDNKSENVSPTLSGTDILRNKDISPPKRRISMGNLEANQLSDKDVKNSTCSAATLQPFEFSDNAKRKLSFESTEECSLTSENKTYRNSHERNHNIIWENIESHGSVALKVKKSVIKNDNEINKEPRPQGLKRKLDRTEKGETKKLCRRNSNNSSSSESVPNENNPFNVKTNNPSSVFNMEPKNKDFFHKQKINNNGVVLKMDHVKKKSHSKPNHVIENQNSE